MHDQAHLTIMRVLMIYDRTCVSVGAESFDRRKIYAPFFVIRQFDSPADLAGIRRSKDVTTNGGSSGRR